MTTLPQSTSIRLPRNPSGPGQQLAIPAYTATGGQPPPPPQSGMTMADIWRVIRANVWLIVVMVILSGAAGFGIYRYLRVTSPRYTSVATVAIDNQSAYDPLQVYRPERAPYELVVQTTNQANRLMSEGLWADVISSTDSIRATDWYQSLEQQAKDRQNSKLNDYLGGGTSAASLARESLESNFRALPVADSPLIRVEMSTRKPEDAQLIVQQIVNTYIEQQRKINQGQTQRDYNAARDMRDRYQREIASLQSSLADSQQRLSSGGVNTAGSKISAREIELSALKNAQLKAQLDENESDSLLGSIEAQVQQGIDPSAVEREVGQDLSIMRTRESLDQYDLEIAAAQATRSPEDRYLKALVVKRDLLQQKLDQRTAEARAIARSSLLDGLRTEVSSKKAEVERLNRSVEQVMGELAELSASFGKYQDTKNDLESYKALLKDMQERVFAIEGTMRAQNTGVTWAQQPTRPDVVSFPNIKVIMPMAILAGLALSLGIAFARELLDNSVRSPRDVARVGQLTLLGMIPDESDDPQVAGIPLHTAISAAPNSAIAEQFRQVRTRLQHAASLDTTRTIVVTSPSAQDGKSMVACNLAAGLALNGRRILLVDSNFRRAELHKLFKVSNEIGFSNVLDSVSNLEAAVKPTDIPNLELLPSGPKPGNPTELIESPLFNDFIDRALEEYDHVIFDTGPLLVVSEAVALAPRVDGVISVVRAKANSRGVLARLRDTLKQTKAENLGVVLNGVRSLKAGYYRRNIKAYYAYQNELQ